MTSIDELHERLRALDPIEAEELAKRLLSDVLVKSKSESSDSTASSSSSSIVTLALIRGALHRPLEAGIESSPDICGGEPRIVRTRIPVWTLVQLRRLGVSEAEILKSYPSLRAEDLVHAWAYAAWHRAEIEEQIRQHEAA